MIAAYCRCDRCGTHAGAFVSEDAGVIPPDDWRVFSGPARGSTGARSDRDYALCPACDDALYDWLN